MVAVARRLGPRPRRLRIRVYAIGFGDCFLLTFDYRTGPRHVLIDFGSTAAARKGTPLDLTIAEDIARVTEGKLHGIVVSHRHADHLSGFTPRKGKGPGDIIRRCARHAVVIQPWTEDPALAPTATGPRQRRGRRALAFAATRSLEAMHEVAAVIARRAGNIDMSDVEAEAPRAAPSPDPAAVLPPRAQPAPAALAVGEGLRETLRFLGETNLKNLAAVKNLMTMSTPDKRHYVHFGSRSGLETVLPGVRVTSWARRRSSRARRSSRSAASIRRSSGCWPPPPPTGPRPPTGVSSPASGSSPAGRRRDPRAGSSGGCAPSMPGSCWSSSASSTTP
jgi:hypothetical protein